MNTLSLWLPFVGTIIGGGLVVAGQYIERYNRNKNEDKNILREIYAFCRKLEAEMPMLCMQIALSKVQCEVHYHAYKINKSDLEFEQHKDCARAAVNSEANFGIAKANFISHVRKFQVIHRIPQHIEEHLGDIRVTKVFNAKEYDPSKPLNPKQISADNFDLTNKYLEDILLPIKMITDEMQRILCSIK